jgi:predicted lipoprotein with Yx(FWY)xxD motif
MTRLLTILAAAAALAIAGCGGDDDSSDSGSSANPYGGGAAAATEEASADATTAEAPAVKGKTIKLTASQFGQVLFDGDDQAIYLFDKESGAKSECYGECAAAWPPVTTDGEPQAGNGVKTSLLGTTERDDGSTQVTYNGHPLYYYAHEGPGVVTCHNVDEFGGLWLAVDAAGDSV